MTTITDEAKEIELSNAEALYAEFRKATPSAPDWYQLADHCIGILMLDYIKRLKGRC